MATYSNWREDLIEVIDTPTTEKKAEKKIKETKVNNKVVINPTFKEAVAEMGGQILEVAEVDDKKGSSEDPQIKSKEKRQGMIKRQVLLKKLQAVRAGGGTDITAGYEPDGDQLNELKKSTLGSYVKKASKDLANRSFDHGESEKRMYEPDKEDEKETKKQATRQKGIDRAADKLAKEEVEIDENRLVKKLTRPIRKAKRIGKRVLDTFDSDPGRAHTIGSLGNPSVKNDDKRAAERKAGKKKVAEGYAKPNKELPKGSKVHVKKGVKVQGKYVKEASAVLDANTKISNKEKRDKLEKELATLTKRAKAMKKHGSGYHPFLHGEEVEKVDEGIMKMVKKVIRSKKPAKKAEKATDAGARAKRALARKVHAKYVSGSEDNVPDDIRDHYEVNERTFATEGKKRGLWDNIHAKRKRGEKPAKPGDKDYPKTLNVEGLEKARKNVGADKCWDGYKAKGTKKKGGKEVPNCVKEEDKAYNYVVSKLKKKYGDGVLTKGDKMPEPSAAQKKKNAEIRAKRAKEDGRDATEKASDGRYSDRYSNRGSD